jgi:hypothetical protein
MKNKNILYGLLGVGAIAGLYFWNKNKKSDTKKCPNGTKKVQVMCAVAPCPQMEVCA